jgi:predicted N-acyltransferase
MSAPASHPATQTSLSVRVVPAISEIAAAAWDACANPGAPSRSVPKNVRSALEAKPALPSQQLQLPAEDQKRQDYPFNPFISHDFLSSLEASLSATRTTGWQPQHLLVEGPAGEILGAAPCYLKSHSRGEYVFDQGWAEAYERAGGSYYPKLQVSVPFTPATGRRLLVKPGAQAQAAQAALAAGLVALCQRRGASSVHATFLAEDEWRFLAARGFLQRIDQQFHWDNAGYGSFEEFLSALAARKRKIIRRERRDALTPGISVHWLTGSDLTEGVWDAFFAFYMETGSRKWGRPYLTRPFFSMVGEKMRDRILLVMAKRAGRFVAGALNFIGSDTLFGRHWGAIENHPFLHFELCYYQAIEYAIANRLRRVEAGAQGEHKVARGYVPLTTYSSHYIADPALRQAIADYLKRERVYVQAAGEELAAFTPFRKNRAGE